MYNNSDVLFVIVIVKLYHLFKLKVKSGIVYVAIPSFMITFDDDCSIANYKFPLVS